MNSCKNIVFDMGRVLTDYDADAATRHFTDDPAIIREVNLIVYHSGEWTMMDAGLISEEEAIRSFRRHASSEKVAEIAIESFQHWDEYNMYLHPGMDQVVRDLKAAGHGVYVLSNISMRVASEEKMKQHLPAPECYDGIFTSAPHKCLKPQHMIYELFCQENHVKAEDCLFIDDLERNVKGAEECGMQGYVFDGDVEKLRKFLELPEKASK